MIQLGQPWALLALAAIPVIVLLHLLRPRRRVVTVPTTALWREALAERRRGMGLRRLLGNLSLLMLVLFALVAALALAAPEWLGRASESGDTVIVLDASASMQTRSGSGTRFDAARAEAAALVDALPVDSRALIMTSARAPALRSGFESSRETLHAALADLAATDESGRPRDALSLALSLLRGREGARVVFITDGAFDPDQDPGSPRVQYRFVGVPARNVAITRFDFRPEVNRDDRFQVLLTVRNYTAAPVSVPAQVTLERRTLIDRVMELPAGGEDTLVLPFEGAATGRARARIRVDDDLEADDHAFAVVNVSVPLRVLLVTPGSVYLESVLAAMPGVELAVAAAVPGGDLADAARLHDVVVLDRVPAPALPPGSFLLVDTLAPGLSLEEAGVVDGPRVAGQGDSALMRGVDLAGVRIERARRVTHAGERAGLQRLFWSRDTDLALALLEPQRRVVYLGFDLSRSTLPLRAAFPLLMSQAVAWLRPRDGAAAPTQIAAGERWVIRAPAGHEEVILRLPSGVGRVLPLADGVLEIDDTSRAGIYAYTVGQVARHFAVNVTDARESDVSRRAAPPSRPAVRAASAQATVVRPLWPYLAMLALALLALEWGVWCLRTGRA